MREEDILWTGKQFSWTSTGLRTGGWEPLVYSTIRSSFFNFRATQYLNTALPLAI